MAAILWEEFCSDHNIIKTSVTLFETSGDVVIVTPHGNDQRLLLRRSAAMEKLVISEVSKVLADFYLGTEEYEGLIYMMFWRDGQQVIPLYIGKSEKYGKQGNNLSANIARISSDKSK